VPLGISLSLPSGELDVDAVRHGSSVYGTRESGVKHTTVVFTHIICLMTQEAHELLQRALALPENERAELAGNLISSLDATVDLDADAAWQQEVARRLQEVESGAVKTVSWEAVRRKGRSLLDAK
jgi:putative addiction module component (TIGR02574 family)